MPLTDKYNPQEAESRIAAAWQANLVNAFDRDSDKPVYSIDTPPATVSGRLHLGHVYSYCQTDFMARFWRMNGYNVFYPMGYDDNGLPTDRLVQKTTKITPEQVGRKAYIEACLAFSQEAEADYQALWQRLGLSVDWRYTYRTIDALSRRTSQASFIDLYQKGLVYQKKAPVIWCPECRTAIAQADLDDLDRQSEFVTLPFPAETGEERLLIATTRPELLPACVAVFVHPADGRYQDWIGQMVRVPLFGQTVPVLADEKADPGKGTGAVMCCTFGDTVDVEWWHRHHLPLISAIDREGKMTQAAGEYAGLSIKNARAAIIRALDQKGEVLKIEPVAQSVRVHERCDTPVEYILASQWFVKILDYKEPLLKQGQALAWYPAMMAGRYQEWVENLHWDWCISRQRSYGVPFPLWKCAACGEIHLAGLDELPVDPLETGPRTACSCGSRDFIPEQDVMDTWATSSLTPQIAGKMLDDPNLYAKVFPYSLRSQAHEIIRTWTFYTLTKSYHNFDALPWKAIAISGWALAAQGTGKISKSKGGGPVAPMAILERFSADAVRYWAASTGFGRDVLISEEKIQSGQRWVTKLWNVARFCEGFIRDVDSSAVPTDLTPADRWMMNNLQELIARVTELMRGYDYSTAKNELETFFWHDLADNYLEMVKQRLYGEGQTARGSAQFCLFQLLLNLLKLLAPFFPYITDELYQALFAAGENCPSVHRSRWPEPDARFTRPEMAGAGEALLAIASAVRRYKSEHNLSLGSRLDRLQLACVSPGLEEILRASTDDIASITRADRIEIVMTLDPSLTRLVSDGPVDLAINA